MNIPNVPTNQLVYIDGFPVIPLIALMLLKLQAWEDHRNSSKSWEIPKQWVDAGDLGGLLPIAARRGDSLKKESWIPQNFSTAAKKRLTRYLERNSSQKSGWLKVGLSPA